MNAIVASDRKRDHVLKKAGPKDLAGTAKKPKKTGLTIIRSPGPGQKSRFSPTPPMRRARVISRQKEPRRRPNDKKAHRRKQRGAELFRRAGGVLYFANDYLCMCKESSESCAPPARTTAQPVGDGDNITDGRIMAPRQRLTTQHSHEELSSTSTFSAEESKPLVESHRAQDPTEVAREQHDFFNLVALVRRCCL